MKTAAEYRAMAEECFKNERNAMCLNAAFRTLERPNQPAVGTDVVQKQQKAGTKFRPFAALSSDRDIKAVYAAAKQSEDDAKKKIVQKENRTKEDIDE